MARSDTELSIDAWSVVLNDSRALELAEIEWQRMVLRWRMQSAPAGARVRATAHVCVIDEDCKLH